MLSFHQILHRGYILKFLLGQDSYFIRDSEIAVNHATYSTWAIIKESIETASNKEFYLDGFWDGMKQLLEIEDINLGLWYFALYALEYKRTFTRKPDEKLFGLFLQLVEHHKGSLIQDKRVELFVLYHHNDFGLYGAINNLITDIEKDSLLVQNDGGSPSNSEKNQISKFSICDQTGRSIEIRLNPPKGGTYFFDSDEDLYYEISHAEGRGLKWTFNESEIYINDSAYRIWGLPSPDLQKVIVIYPMDHGTYPAPNNAVIHNADGSVYMQLSPPELISDLAKQQQERDPKGSFMVYFEDVSWGYDSNSNTVVAISIGYNWNWREQRALNPETGEFGECLSSGMR